MANELAIAVLRGAIDDVRALLAAGADAKGCAAQYPDQWNHLFDSRPAPLLNLAALVGTASVVKLLIDHGADVNEHPMIERNYQTHDDTYEVAGETALTMAAREGFLDVVRVLVEAGAEVGRSNGAALRAASKGKHTDVAAFLRASKKAKSTRPAVYTQLWPERIVASLRGVVDGEPLRRVVSWGNRQSDFGQSRAAVGDVLVPFHILKGQMCPIARMTLVWKGVVREWNELHPVESVVTFNLNLQLMVGDRGTAQHFSRPLPVDILRELRYDSRGGPRPLPLKAEGTLSRATAVDGLFRLTPESGDELLWLPWI